MMTVSELKLKIFRQIDSLEKNQLEELYAMLQGFGHDQNDLGHWENLTEAQRKGISDAIDQIDEGEGIPNESVLAAIREKYLNV